MKMNSIIKKTLFVIAITSLFSVKIKAQDQTPANGKRETAIELAYYKNTDTSKSAVAIITAINAQGKYVPENNVKVNFYVMNGKEEKLLKSASTNNKGKALIMLPNDLPLDDSFYFTIVAKIENNALLADAREQVHYKDASLILNLDPHDTAQLVIAKVTELGKDGKEIPVQEAEVKFYVKRMFGFMAASEDNTITTDENGEASFAFPKNVSGDTAGSITITARMEDNRQFGNVENKTTELWGTVLAPEKNAFPRALWEPYAPLPLVITISTLFGGVWCIFFYIFFQLRKIKKEVHLRIADK